MFDEQGQLRDWLFRTIIFEADSQKFRDAGIKIGADQSAAEKNLLEETLSDYPLNMRSDALRMSRLYASLYCFENSIRELIKERLESNFGSNWWTDGVPKKIRDRAEDRMVKAETNTWLEIQNSDVLSFADFGNLTDIIVDKWETFSDLIPSQHWLKQRLDEIEQVRNFLAHNRYLEDAEFQRIEMYTEDWRKQVGV